MSDQSTPTPQDPASPELTARPLPRRVVALVITTPVITGIALLGLYATTFHDGMSDRSEVWGQFGDLVGGVLNPLIAWLTLVVVAVSLRYTVVALLAAQRQTEAAQAQTKLAQEHFKLAVNQLEEDRKEQAARRNAENQAERERVAILMYQAWVNPDMQRMRIEAWVNHVPSPDPFPVSILYLGSYRERNDLVSKARYGSLQAVFEFIADVNTTIDIGLVDELLLMVLLGSSIKPWLVAINRMSLKNDAGDTSQESLELEHWFENSVKTLHGKMLARASLSARTS